MREAKEDWLELGRDLIARGLAAPRLVVTDGAPGLISAAEEIWPRADRQHCAVHRLRNLQAKLPKSDHDRIRFNYWSALSEATGVNDGKLRLQVLISELEHAGYDAAARCLADDLDALLVHTALCEMLVLCCEMRLRPSLSGVLGPSRLALRC